MIINQIAHTVFDSFDDTDIVVAILNHNGSYVSNKLDVFEKVFAQRGLLEELCGRINDGQEPLITNIDGYLVAARGLSAGLKDVDSTGSRQVGYAIMLLPGESSKPSLEYIEIILEHLSLISGLIEQNQKNYIEFAKSDMEMPAFAGIN